MIHWRRDNRAATIDIVVVVIEDVDGRDGAAHGDNYARRRTTAEEDPFLGLCRRSSRARDRSLLPPREDGGDSGADVVARVNGRRDDRAATIDVVVVIEDVDERDGAERGDNDARRRTMDDGGCYFFALVGAIWEELWVVAFVAPSRSARRVCRCRACCWAFTRGDGRTIICLTSKNQKNNEPARRLLEIRSHRQRY
jgi:hypothetical protein